MKPRLRIACELERLRRKNLQTLHPLKQLFWESTLRCNVHCLHCGSDCNASVSTADMPMDDFLRVIDREITPHVNPHEVLIIISGGEPLMRTDLADIGQQLYQRGYPWGMVTNGLAMTDERFRQLRRSGLRSMSISLDGLQDDHIWLRQHPLAFEKACHTIELAAKEHMTFDVVTCVNRRNITHLEEIRQLLIRLGCRHWRLVTIDPMGRAKDNPELILDNRQFAQLLDYIEAQRTNTHNPIRLSYSCEGFLGEREARVRGHLYMCVAGITTASILIDGSISACTSIRGKYYQGNIYRDSFWDVWENGFREYRNRQWMKRLEPCNTCAMFRYCEGNGMHLRREDGSLMLCHLQRLSNN